MKKTIIKSIRRLLAYMLDILLLYVVFGGVQWIMSISIGFPSWEGLGENALALKGWVLLTISLPSWLYFIFSDWKMKGVTIGKRVFKLKACTLDNKNLSVGSTLLRTSIKLFPWELSHTSILLPIPLLISSNVMLSQWIGLTIANLLLVLYLLILVIYKGERSVHDLIVGTKVITTDI